MARRSLLIKFSIFCTGFTGIVAEYIMATLASYCLGDSVTQWTIIISLMLFAMGVGSQLSMVFRDNLLDTFINIELILAALVASSALLVYTLFAYIEHLSFFIYLLAFIIGLLIGLELPLATRINADHQQLASNVSSILAKDYLGALFGGILFAFVGLPLLGLAASAVVVGAVNFCVALILGGCCFHELRRGKLFIVSTFFVAIIIVGCLLASDHLVLFAEQKRYRDKIVFSERTRYQKIVLTNFRNDYWLYLNGNQQFSTIDEHRYHETLVHPAMLLHGSAQRVLVLGGGDGLAVREILRHPTVKQITVVDIDRRMTELAKVHPLLVQINDQALLNSKVIVSNIDAFSFVSNDPESYQIIISDFPDPQSIDLARLYSYEFFQLVFKRLDTNGVFITQAGSPTYARLSFQTILKTVRALSYPVVPLHSYLPTMGDWGWVIAKKSTIDNRHLQELLLNLSPTGINLRYLDQETLRHLFGGWGKNFYSEYNELQINSLLKPSLHRYYRQGRWDLY